MTTASIGIAVLAAALLFVLVVRRQRTAAPPLTAQPPAFPMAPGEWHAPVELSGPRPRSVRLTKNARLAFLFTAILLAAATLVCAYCARGIALTWEITRNGASAPGEITGKFPRGESSFVRYVFRVDRRTYSRTANVGKQLFGQLQPGQRIRVRYMPGDPERSFLENEVASAGLWIAMVFAVVVAVFTGRALADLRRKRELATWGEPFAAEVTGTRARQGNVEVRFKFHDSAGREITGSTAVGAAGAPAKGDVVTVLAHARRPGRNTLYPLPMFEVNPPGPSR